MFTPVNGDYLGTEVKAELDKRFATHEEAVDFLNRCKDAVFTVANVSKKPLKRSPAPPFTTSTLQQEAARKLGFTVSQTMRIAQQLYENGRITYMRTDSVNLSALAINSSKEAITKLYGEPYSTPRNFHTQSKGAQEAHEAIRPTHMENASIDGTAQEKRLYDLIWKRSIASQMAEAQIEKTTVSINIGGHPEKFVARGEVIVFDGFLKVYKESTDDEELSEEMGSLPAVQVGEQLSRECIASMERFSQGQARQPGQPHNGALRASPLPLQDSAHSGLLRPVHHILPHDALLSVQTVLRYLCIASKAEFWKNPLGEAARFSIQSSSVMRQPQSGRLSGPSSRGG